MNRKRVILTILLGVLGISVLYAYLATPQLEKAQPQATSPKKNAVVTTSGKMVSADTRGRINFDLMESTSDKYPGAKRDIFNFKKPPPVKRPVVQPVEIVQPEPVSNVAIIPDMVVEEEIQQALAQFIFLGFLEKEMEKTVFLSSSGRLFLVKKGETFGLEREFLVTDINEKLLKVSQVGRDELIVVPLIEKQKLAASVSSPVSLPRPEVAPGFVEQGRVLPPQRRVARPIAPQQNDGLQGEQTPQELNLEFNPEQAQE